MASTHDLQDWVLEAVKAEGGSASLVAVARQLWQRHEHDLRQSGDLFYTWQYDMRWAAQVLRDSGKLAKVEGNRSGTWSVPQATSPAT